VHQLNDESDHVEAGVGDPVRLQWRVDHSYVIGSEAPPETEPQE
jgi:hypothetical protein